jgi:chromosome segregation ATPase
MAEVAAALATPSEKGIAQTLAVVADLLAENASLKQKNAAAGEERVHSGIQIAALESVIKERDASIKHLVGLRETTNSNLSDAETTRDSWRAEAGTLYAQVNRQKKELAHLHDTLEYPDLYPCPKCGWLPQHDTCEPLPPGTR